jgi:hypothetical protein
MDAGRHLEPDRDAMWRHVSTLFGGDFDGAADGLVELAWKENDFWHGQQFCTDELEALVDRAFELNHRPGVNVYVGAALRRPDTPRHARAKDEHLHSQPFTWNDLDKEWTAASIAECKRRGAPPNMTVVTGRHPFLRAHPYWRLAQAIRDAAELRALCATIAKAIGGDPSVVNPSRILRIGGSLAWPVKPGRILELTEVHIPDDGRPSAYWPATLMERFGGPSLFAPPTQNPTPGNPPENPPDIPAGKEHDTQAPAPARKSPPGILPDIPPGISIPGLAIGSHSVEALLAAIRAGNHWHDNTVRLVGHWLARGWSNSEILAVAPTLTLPGWTTAQTQADLARMIEGGRRKWNIPNPTHAVEDALPPTIDLMQWTADRYAGEAKPIEWLCRGTIPLGMPALIAAMGGLGKSYLALDLALQIAAGVAGLEQPRKILGGRIAVEGTAVIVTAEDSFHAVHRRLNRIDPTSRRLRHPKRLIVLPLPDAGGSRPLIGMNGKALTRMPFFDDLKRQLAGFTDLRLVVIDPLQAFALADVNADPAAAQFLWSAMAELAAATGATILLTHHMRKDGMLRIADGDDAREAIRGTTALVDGARLAYALWKLDDETARPVCNTLQVPFERGRIVRGAVVKANDEADHGTHTYRREESGLLVQLESEPDGEAESTFSIAQAREVLKEIQRRFEEGTPFSHSPRSGARYLGHYLQRQCGMSRTSAADLITDWMNNGVIGIDVVDRRSKLSGLKVLSWL